VSYIAQAVGVLASLLLALATYVSIVAALASSSSQMAETLVWARGLAVNLWVSGAGLAMLAWAVDRVRGTRR